ncbi:hypothetical protein H920_14693 [Fukomys damarensis]|uniref:Uncharacterized protein n=1 Tax=Fukomys damarensis TaxID=885580 RepID=A0A091D122_FUKDA|nr:hypothetical protein H920_14693 [Fukomys damarensis]
MGGQQYGGEAEDDLSCANSGADWDRRGTGRVTRAVKNEWSMEPSTLDVLEAQETIADTPGLVNEDISGDKDLGIISRECSMLERGSSGRFTVTA